MTNDFYKSLSKKYLNDGGAQLSKKEVDAYLTARMPATFAALSFVLNEVKEIYLGTVTSLLDVGAGPGTGALAAKEIFEGIKKVTLMEKNGEMIKRGRELIEGSWIQEGMEKAGFEPHDLILFGYSLTEVPQEMYKDILNKAWNAGQLIVIVEPGTPRGFSNILKAREILLELGGHILAPCPHANSCPMKGEKWCHFSTRLERTREHREMKGGAMGYEDEKFSFLVVGKEKQEVQSRVVGHPVKHKGYVSMELCSEKGLEKRIVSKKEGEGYKKARKIQWGEKF